MPIYLMVWGVPRVDDVHETPFDISQFVHQHPRLRAYRDRLIATYGLSHAYDQTSNAVENALRRHFTHHVEVPLARLYKSIDRLEGVGLEVAMAVNMLLIFTPLDPRFEAEIEKIEAHVLDLFARVRQAPVVLEGPEGDEPIARLRRLFATQGAWLGARAFPEQPAVAEILAREFGGERVIFRKAPPTRPVFLPAQDRALVDIFKEHGLAAALEVATAMPVDVPVERTQRWDYEGVCRELFEVVYRDFLGRLEDEAFLEERVEEACLKLEPALDPTGAFLTSTRELVPGVTLERLPEYLELMRQTPVYQAHHLEWIEEAEAVGFPIDTTGMTIEVTRPD